MIRLNHVNCGYGEHTVLGNVDFRLEAGDRIGLLGPNGAGKSTLVKSLVGELPLLRGERIAHPDLELGYFAQHTVESLHEGQSPIDHMRDIAPGVSVQDFRDYLGRWSFPGTRAFELVDGFSGGERASGLGADCVALGVRVRCSTNQPTIWIWKRVRLWPKH